MTKEFIVNIKEYILLELLQMRNHFSYNEIINEKLKELENIVSKQIFGEFFSGKSDINILQESLIVRYLYETDEWTLANELSI